jgi:hypothetical protein
MNDKIEELVKVIKAGTLAINQRNANLVRDAYCWSVIWDQAFRDLGLNDLPDPDGISEYPQILEDWLAKAFRGNFASEELCRASLHKLREVVIKKGLGE